MSIVRYRGKIGEFHALTVAPAGAKTPKAVPIQRNAYGLIDCMVVGDQCARVGEYGLRKPEHALLHAKDAELQTQGHLKATTLSKKVLARGQARKARVTS